MLQPNARSRWRLAPLVAAALASGSFLTIMDQGIVSLTNLIWVRQLGRTLSVEQLGDYYCLLSLVLLIVNAQAQVLTAPYAVRCHKKKEAELDLYTGALFAQEFAVMIATAVIFGAAFLICLSIGWGSSMAVAAICLAGPAYLLRMFARYVAFARNKHLSAVLLDIGVGVVQLSGLAWLTWTNQVSLVNAFIVLALACGLCAPLWLRYVKIRWARVGNVASTWNENWTFGRWALLSFAVGGVLSHIFPTLVAAFANRTEAGFLGACTTISGFGTMFVVGLANALTPVAARAYSTEGRHALARVLFRNALVMGLAVGSFLVVAIIGGDWILADLIYDHRFRGQGPTLALLVGGVLATAASVIFGNGLWAPCSLLTFGCPLAVRSGRPRPSALAIRPARSLEGSSFNGHLLLHR
jgi:O-antigen/teichoic acid export membrane protein